MKSRRVVAPTCTQHPDAHTWHDGYYGKRGVRGYSRHPRFRCRPDAARPETHGFTNHRRVNAGGDPYCEHCDRAVGKDEGPRAPRNFEFAIGEIARALYDLAAGESYRGTSKRRRLVIDRPARHRWHGEERFSSQGHLTRDWLEEFAPAVLDGKEPTSWPRVLVLDDKGYNPRLGSRRAPGFRIYGAFDAQRQQLVRLAFYPDGKSWRVFLDELPGQPEVVVADHGNAILGAVRDRWPTVRIWRSHWHLQHRQLTNEAIPRDGLIAPGHRLAQLIEGAFRSEDDWWSFVAQCRAESAELPRLQGWLAIHAQTVAAQVADIDFVPKSTGGLEERLRRVGDRIGERRGFANKDRTDLLLRLWVLHLNHRAHVDEFVHQVRLHLEANGNQVARHSRRGGRSAVTGNGHRGCLCHPARV